MKKPDFKNLFLVACAVIAVFVCFLPNSVTVFTMPQEGAEPVAPAYCSFFTLVEGVQWAVSLPFAGACACLSLLLSGIYAVNKKSGLLTAIRWLALAGAMLSVVLIMIKNNTVQMVPNVIVPIALMVQYGLTFSIAAKQEAQVQKKQKKPLK